MKSLIKTTLFIPFFLYFSGLFPIGKNLVIAEIVTIPFETIASGDLKRKETYSEHVIYTSEQLRLVGLEEVVPEGKVNFKKELLIAVILGTQKSEDASVEIVKITHLATTNNSWSK